MRIDVGVELNKVSATFDSHVNTLISKAIQPERRRHLDKALGRSLYHTQPVV